MRSAGAAEGCDLFSLQTKTPDLHRPGVFMSPEIRTDWLASMELARQSGLQQGSAQLQSSTN
jgi:hypothetical protein